MSLRPLITQLIQRLPSPERRSFWILLAIAFKLCVVAFFIFQARPLNPDRMIGGIVLRHNDYIYFQEPVETYLKTGRYEYHPGEPFAGRMPGYAIPYLLIRLVFPETAANIVLILFQMLLSFASIYYLAYIAKLLFHKDAYFYTVYGIALLSIFTNTYDYFTLAESFATSAMVFHTYFLITFLRKKNYVDLWIAGGFLMWAIFCRPYLGLLIVIVPLALLIYFLRSSTFTEMVKVQLIFLSLFILAETSWITRNYILLGKFIPLEASFEEAYDSCKYKGARTAINKMILSWGGISAGYYTYLTPGAWFEDQERYKKEAPPFPDKIFHTGFQLDSLIQLKQLYQTSCDESLPAAVRDSIEEVIIEKANRYKQSSIAHDPLQYYVINPVIRFRRYVLVPGTQDVQLPQFQEMNLVQKGLKVLLSLMYISILLGGFLGIGIRLLQGNINVGTWILMLIPLSNIFAVVLVAVDAQVRYLAPVFPFLLIWAAYTLLFFWQKIKKRI